MKADLVKGCKQSTLHFELITPEVAECWLEKNTSNYRAKTPNTVNKYVTDMEQGLWTVNTATIAFTSSDVLIDGQHRLEAIVKSGVSIYSFVMRNCPDELISDPNQDKGKSRNASTYLQREGISNASAVASAMRCIYRIGLGNAVLSGGGHTALTDAQVIASIPLMPQYFFEIVGSVARNSILKKIYKPAVVSSAIFLAVSHDKAQAEEFVEILSKQRDAPASHPANVLREFSLANRRLILDTKFLGLFLTAFNLAIKGEKREIIRCHTLPELSRGQKAAIDLITTAVSMA